MKKYITQIINLLPTHTIKSYARLISCVAFFFITTIQEGYSYSIKKEDKIYLAKIEDYLNNIKYLSANFIQESPDGSVVEGLFYLSRPGKMRVEYIADPKILIIVNGSVLSYIDTELDETSHLHTNTTPASFLTRKKISFYAKDVNITNFSNKNDYISVSIVKKNRKEAGEFTLTFQKKPFKFIKMEVKNELEEKTSIILTNINFTKNLANNLFILKKGEEELY